MCPTSASRSGTVTTGVGQTAGSSGRCPAFGAAQTFATGTRTVAAWPGVTARRSAAASEAVTRRGVPLAYELVLLRLLGLAADADLLDDGRIGERRRVTERAVLSDVAQEPPHDLAAARLRQLRCEHDVRRLRDRPDLLRDVVAQLLELLDRSVAAAFQRDERDDRLSGLRIVPRGDRSFGDFLVVDEGRLDLDRRDTVAGDVHHIVDAAEQPEVAVLVDTRTVAGEVHVAELGPVRLAIPRVVAVDAAEHRRPRLLQHEIAAAARADLLALLVVDRRLDAGERLRRRARLGGRDPRQRRDHDHPGLGLPPRVDDRAVAAADVLLVPDPRLRVDRLADRAEQLQRREIVLLRVLRPPLHVRADRRRRRVEDGHAVALDDRPPAILVGIVGCALVHHGRRAVAERPVDDVAVAGDPADVGGAPVHV